MNNKYFDITIIGAGMFGSATAKYLGANNAKVALIGPEEPISKEIASTQRAFGAYYDAARITRRVGWDDVWATIDSRSLGRYRNIEAEAETPFFHECGSLIIMAKSIEKKTNLIVSKCQASNIPVERMSSEAIEYHWPYVKMPNITGGVEGLFEHQMAGYIDPRKLVAAQLTLFQNVGGELIRGTVIKVEKNQRLNLWEVYVLINGQTDIVYSKQIVVAAGSFVNHNQILPPGCQLELYAFTEPNLLFEIAPDDLELMQNMPTIITVDPENTDNKNMSIYLLPPIKYPDGKWYAKIGPGMQPIVQQLDSLEQMRQWYLQQQITQQQRDFLMQMKHLLLPDLTPASIKEACCIIEKTSTSYPYIGQINEDNSLNIVVGGNGHGARGSDEIGRLAANIVMQNTWDLSIDKEVFTPILKNDTTSTSKLISTPPYGLA